MVPHYYWIRAFCCKFTTLHVVETFFTLVKKSNVSYTERDALQILTVREADYLDLIKDNDCTLYNEVLIVLCSDNTRELHGKLTYKTLYEDIQSIALKLEELDRKEIQCRSNNFLLPFD